MERLNSINGEPASVEVPTLYSSSHQHLAFSYAPIWDLPVGR
jgi:hypothetical protein